MNGGTGPVGRLLLKCAAHTGHLGRAAGNGKVSSLFPCIEGRALLSRVAVSCGKQEWEKEIEDVVKPLTECQRKQLAFQQQVAY